MTETKRLRVILVSVPALLLIPLIGMQISSQVQWSPLDFLVMGALLLSAGLALEFLLRRVSGLKGRILAIGTLILVVVVVWAELAVGVFGSPLAGS